MQLLDCCAVHASVRRDTSRCSSSIFLALSSSTVTLSLRPPPVAPCSVSSTSAASSSSCSMLSCWIRCCCWLVSRVSRLTAAFSRCMRLASISLCFCRFSSARCFAVSPTTRLRLLLFDSLAASAPSANARSKSRSNRGETAKLAGVGGLGRWAAAEREAEVDVAAGALWAGAVWGGRSRWSGHERRMKLRTRKRRRMWKRWVRVVSLLGRAKVES